MKTSTLTIFNYRERGYEGSVIFCSSSTPSNSTHLMIPDNFGNITENGTLNVSLIHLPAATNSSIDYAIDWAHLVIAADTNSSDVRIQCTANATGSPTIAWRVYQSKCGIWERLLRSEMKGGVSVEQRSLSPYEELSTLTITNYRERGYSGSVIECAYFTHGNYSETVNFTNNSSSFKPGNNLVTVNFTIDDGKSDGPTEDWTLQLHSLEHSTDNISQLDLQLSCTASASSGPSIAWHVYFPLCGVWNTLHQMTELGVLVEDRATSPCLKTSKLSISDYAERGYQGALIVCTAYAAWKSANQSANLTLLDGRPTVVPLELTHLEVPRLAQLHVGVNDSNLQLLCTSSSDINSRIVWRVYQLRCGTWESFELNSKNGAILVHRSLSSCVQTSTMTILSYVEEGYHGAVLECLVNNPRNSANYSANFTIPGNETDQSHEKQTIEIDSLVEVTQGVDPSNKQLLCTAIGSSIQWLIYLSNLTSSVINDTDRGVLIERNRVSSCVFSSTLTILNYREHSYAGSVVTCTTSIPANTGNHSANFTLPSRLDEENLQNAKPGLTLKHVTEGVNQSDIRLMCRANTVSNIAEFKWKVIQPVCRLQTPLLNSTEVGVLIKESSSVRSSTLEITDYPCITELHFPPSCITNLIRIIRTSAACSIRVNLSPEDNRIETPS
ncbi:uncharacterized protein [Asterias amurensis]|uniref:uncharacterized protein n=1 Tax=Asterias amurensis TaxID=7602 RepID=UPI003AB8F646